MKVIGISGAQGGGKTTLLAELALRGYEVDNFKVSRSVQQMLGWSSLDRVTESMKTMVDFQCHVLKHKVEHDQDLVDRPGKGVIFVERTFADIFAYTQLWCLKLGATSEAQLKFIKAYGVECQYFQQSIYSGVVLLPFMDHVTWEDDPRRAKREDIDTVYRAVKGFLPDRPKRIEITAKSVSDRADQVETFIRSL